MKFVGAADLYENNFYISIDYMLTLRYNIIGKKRKGNRRSGKC